MPDGRESTPSPGQIVTFYSFKGGTGRTMALANVAWILAANGMRVLVADWDLESPGLHRFFQPFLGTEIDESPGIIDFIRRYEWAAVRFKPDTDAIGEDGDNPEKATADGLKQLIDRYARVQSYAEQVNWRFPGEGSLSFLSSGKQNSDYQATLSALAWDTFYNNLYGAQFFDALRADLKNNYDYVLIDSRTGLSDIADICTLHLPDVLVDCFTLSTQGIEGAAKIARMVEGHSGRDIRILPVPMRVDPAEKDKVDAGQAFAARLFTGLPAGMSEPERRDYWSAVEVPYRAFYAYEETLAVFGDGPGSPTTLLSSFERIAAHVTRGDVTTLPEMEETLRLRTRQLFARSQPPRASDVILDFSPPDQLWAEWIASVLAGSGIVVRNRWDEEITVPAGDGDRVPRVVAVVTQAYIDRIHDSPSPYKPALAVCLTDARLPHQLEGVPVVFLAGLPEKQAVEKLLDRLDGRRVPGARPEDVRYPVGKRRQIATMPVRNVNFTGREQDLRELRAELRSGGMAVVLPQMQILHGLGGVGKTQLALEYAHRFQADYDLIWWLNCGQPQYIDASLTDLGKRMREVFAASLPEDGSVAEIAKEVLRLLREDQTVRRWLLVYDNADRIDEVRPFLASGQGHVLITSRNGDWIGKGGRSLPVNVFTREESIGHLRQRINSITEAEANKVAYALGDLPLAVATAGAWLAETGFSVQRYLDQLEQQPIRTLSLGQPADAPQEVSSTWDLSLDQLQETSPAAARLFGLCSVMAPDISLDLLYSPAMAAILVQLDRQLSEPMIIGKVIQQINRLALIKLDTNAHHIQVHRLVQAVVRDRMSAEELAQARADVHRVLVAAQPDGEVDDPETWQRYRLIWLHLSPSDAMRSAQESVRQLLIDRVRYLRMRGDLERGRRRATEIELAWEKMLAAITDDAAAESLRRQLYRLRFNKSNIVRDLADFEESRALDEAVLSGQRELLGDEHPHTLMTASGLAASFRALGQYGKALEIDRSTYKSWTRQYGDDHFFTLSAANNLAVSLRLTGEIEDAFAQDRLTFQRRSATLGSRHPMTLSSGGAVARDLLEGGNYADAVAQMVAVWAQCREALGDDDLGTLNARVLLGVALRSNGDAEQAEGHIDEARQGLTRGFGSDSSNTLACRMSQAVNQLALRRIPEAKAGAEAVLDIYEARLGPAHPHSLICKVNIATALYLQHDYEPALAAARSATEGLEAGLGAGHPYTLAAKMVLAAVLAGQGSFADAGAMEERAAGDLSRALGPLHPDTLRCRANMLLTWQEQDVAGAAEQRQAIIDQLTELLGPEHPDVGTLISGGRLLRVIDPQPF
jgi:Tetratricopeptide repeat/CobQ/CobB/MinD/ParA nucleotide binding domain/NB-ARC domain